MSDARNYAKRKANTDDISRTNGFGPPWISPDVWNQLISEHWVTEKWRRKSEVARQNRKKEVDSDVTRHTSGSISFVAHRRKLV